MKAIKLFVADMPSFFKVVNSCSGRVLVTDSSGTSFDLRNNVFLQELLLTAHKGSDQTEINLNVEKDSDFASFLDFMMSDRIAS